MPPRTKEDLSHEIRTAETGLYITYRPASWGVRSAQRAITALSRRELQAVAWRVKDELRRRRDGERRYGEGRTMGPRPRS